MRHATPAPRPVRTSSSVGAHREAHHAARLRIRRHDWLARRQSTQRDFGRDVHVAGYLVRGVQESRVDESLLLLKRRREGVRVQRAVAVGEMRLRLRW